MKSLLGLAITLLEKINSDDCRNCFWRKREHAAITGHAVVSYLIPSLHLAVTRHGEEWPNLVSNMTLFCHRLKLIACYWSWHEPVARINVVKIHLLGNNSNPLKTRLRLSKLISFWQHSPYSSPGKRLSISNRQTGKYHQGGGGGGIDKCPTLGTDNWKKRPTNARGYGKWALPDIDCESLDNERAPFDTRLGDVFRQSCARLGGSGSKLKLLRWATPQSKCAFLKAP